MVIGVVIVGFVLVIGTVIALVSLVLVIPDLYLLEKLLKFGRRLSHRL